MRSYVCIVRLLPSACFRTPRPIHRLVEIMWYMVRILTCLHHEGLSPLPHPQLCVERYDYTTTPSNHNACTFAQAQELARRDAAARDAPTPAETATPVPAPQTLRHRPKKSKRSPQEIAFDSIKASTQFHAPGDMPSDSAQEPDSVSASNSVGGPVPEIQLDSAAASPTAAADQSTAAAVAAPRPDMRATLDNFRMLRSLQGSPSPLWIIAGPLLQV